LSPISEKNKGNSGILNSPGLSLIRQSEIQEKLCAETANISKNFSKLHEDFSNIKLELKEFRKEVSFSNYL